MEWRGDSPEAVEEQVPSAPRTPSPRARALIFRYQGSQLVLLIVGLVFTAIGVPLNLGLNWGLPGEVALSLWGRPAVGNVIDTGINRNVTVNGEHPTVIRFRYQGDAIGECSTRDRAILDSAFPGVELPIETAGSFARIKGTSYALMGAWGILFLIFPGLGLTLLFFSVRSNRREIRAFTDGRPTSAKVTFAGEDFSTRINRRHPLLIKWEFQVAGQSYDGSISSLDPELIGDLLQQKQITVLYDPMDPSVNTVWINS